MKNNLVYLRVSSILHALVFWGILSPAICHAQISKVVCTSVTWDENYEIQLEGEGVPAKITVNTWYFWVDRDSQARPVAIQIWQRDETPEEKPHYSRWPGDLEYFMDGIPRVEIGYEGEREIWRYQNWLREPLTTAKGVWGFILYRDEQGRILRIQKQYDPTHDAVLQFSNTHTKIKANLSASPNYDSLSTYVFKYDTKDGPPTQRIEKNRWNAVREIVTWQRDAAGRKIEERILHADGRLKLNRGITPIKRWAWNKDGKLAQEAHIHPNVGAASLLGLPVRNSRTTYRYDSRQNLIEKTEYLYGDSVHWHQKIKHKWSPEGYLLSKTTLDYPGKRVNRVVYERDSQGHVRKSSHQLAHGSQFFIEYKLDTAGNILSSTQKVPNRPKPLYEIGMQAEYDSRGLVLLHRSLGNAPGQGLLTLNSYDEAGRLRRKDMYLNDTLHRKPGACSFQWEYDSWGNLTKKEVFHALADGRTLESKEKYQWEYDASGRLLDYKHVKDGNTLVFISQKMDKQGRIVQKKYKNPSSRSTFPEYQEGRMEYVYEGKSRLPSLIKYYSNLRPFQIQYWYNNSGKWIKKIRRFLDTKKSTLHITTRKFDRKGHLLAEVRKTQYHKSDDYAKEHGSQHHSVQKYKYDVQGRLTYKWDYSDFGPILSEADTNIIPGREVFDAKGRVLLRTMCKNRGPNKTWIGDEFKIKRAYTKHGQLKEESFWMKGDSLVKSGDYAFCRWTYDSEGRLLEIRRFAADSTPVKKEWHLREYSYYPNGDLKQQETEQLSGRYAGRFFVHFSSDGLEVQRGFKNFQGQVLKTPALSHEPAQLTGERLDSKGNILSYYRANRQGSSLDFTYRRDFTWGPKKPLEQKPHQKYPPLIEKEKQISPPAWINERGAKHLQALEITLSGTENENADLPYRQTFDYDEWGYQRETAYWNRDGSARKIRGGFARMETRYDSIGNLLQARFFDENGRAMAYGKFGFAAWEMTYDAEGHLTSESFFDTEGNPALDPEGISRREWAYDARGNLTGRASFGQNGKLSLPKRDYRAKILMEYNEWGEITKYQAFGIDGKLTLDPLNSMSPLAGTAGYEAEYNSKGQEIERRNYGLNWQAVENQQGYHKIRYRYLPGSGKALKATYNLAGEALYVEEGFEEAPVSK